MFILSGSSKSLSRYNSSNSPDKLSTLLILSVCTRSCYLFTLFTSTELLMLRAPNSKGKDVTKDIPELLQQHLSTF